MHVLFNKGLPVHYTSESPYTGTPAMKEFPGVVYDEAKNTDRLDNFAEAEAVALFVTESTGNLHIACDNGEWTSHRYGIVQVPKVGDKVSYAFNGDYYPCGEIIRVTKGFRVTTSTGEVFNRKKQSAVWKMVGGTWSLVQGHISKLNPEF